MSANKEVSAEVGTVEGIFTNGLQFLYPRSEEGPSLYAILEGAWLGAALVQGIRSKVWECDPTKPNPIAASWANTGLLEVKTVEKGEMAGAVYCTLTPAGERVVACADLLEYEYSMIQQQLDSNFKTDPAKYRALRKGLENYAGAFLPEMVDWVSRGGDAPMDVKPLMFDFCGGNGGYLRAFLRFNPDAAGMLFDRDPGVGELGGVLNRMGIYSGDAMGSSVWFASQAGAYDVVLMSEILHCKGKEERLFMLRRAKSLLKPGGSILVVEQFPGLRMEWRMNDMTQGGQCLLEAQVVAEAQECGLMGVAGIHCLSHYGIRFEQFEA